MCVPTSLMAFIMASCSGVPMGTEGNASWNAFRPMSIFANPCVVWPGLPCGATAGPALGGAGVIVGGNGPPNGGILSLDHQPRCLRSRDWRQLAVTPLTAALETHRFASWLEFPRHVV